MRHIQPRFVVSGLCGAVLLGLAGACGDAEPPTAPGVLSLSSTIQGDGFTRVEGEAAGALWAVVEPDDWNGDLVVLLHGSVDQKAPISLDPLRHWWWNPMVDALVARGFGVAWSSYRVNGFAVEEGTVDTRIAEAMFAARFGRPRSTYLVGWSMGTHVGQKLLETSPARYAGFLSVCGSLG
ncbi:MAG: hypothetical protein ACREN5_13445, partial [Gemmatimonadales bacterium]